MLLEEINTGISLWNINSEKDWEQVAIYRSNQISPYDYASVIIDVSNYYNKCPAMIENNSEYGGIVITLLWNEYEFDRIITVKTKNIDGRNSKTKGLIGIRSTPYTKREANLLLRRYLYKYKVHYLFYQQYLIYI